MTEETEHETCLIYALDASGKKQGEEDGEADRGVEMSARTWGGMPCEQGTVVTKYQ